MSQPSCQWISRLCDLATHIFMEHTLSTCLVILQSDHAECKINQDTNHGITKEGSHICYIAP